jgi:hypothetical protein
MYNSVELSEDCDCEKQASNLFFDSIDPRLIYIYEMIFNYILYVFKYTFVVFSHYELMYAQVTKDADKCNAHHDGHHYILCSGHKK